MWSEGAHVCLELSAILWSHQYLYSLFTDVIFYLQANENAIICVCEIASVNIAGMDQIIFWEIVFTWFYVPVSHS